MYRSGRLRCLEELQEMLAQGDGSGGRLMAWVNSERVLVVEKVPAAGGKADYIVGVGGSVRRPDRWKLAGGMRLVGKWARVDGLDQALGDATPMGAVLITRVVWEKGILRVGWE